MEYCWDLTQIKKNKLNIFLLLLNPKISKEEREYLKGCIADYRDLEYFCKNNISIFSIDEKRKIDYIDKDCFLPRDTYQYYMELPTNIKKGILNSQDIFSYFHAEKEIEYTTFTTDNQSIIDLSNDFYNSLRVHKYLETFYEITDPEKHFIRFISSNHGKTSGNIYCLHRPTYNPYITIEKNDTINDFISLNHEIAHAIFNKTDYPNKQGTWNFLEELEGYFFDFLSFEYLKDKTSNQVIHHLEYDRLEGVQDIFYDFLLTDLSIALFQKGRQIDVTSLQQKFLELDLDINLDDGILMNSLSGSPIYHSIYLLSFLVSLDLEAIYKKDPEHAMFLLDHIRTNPANNIIDMLRKNQITFMDDGYKNLKTLIKNLNQY